MVRPNRIKEYKFPQSNITASAAGLYNAYSDHIINGTIQKVEILSNTYSANGSLFVFVSGTNEQIWKRNGTASTSGAYYPFVYTSDENNATGSPRTFTKRVVNDTIYIVGSGLGNGTSGIGINIIYI